MDAVLINGKQFFSVLKSGMDKNSLKNINVAFLWSSFLVYLSCESVAPLGGIQAGQVLNAQCRGLEALLK